MQLFKLEYASISSQIKVSRKETWYSTMKRRGLIAMLQIVIELEIAAEIFLRRLVRKLVIIHPTPSQALNNAIKRKVL